jgi:ribosome-associated protein
VGDRDSETIRLDQFLKLTGAVETGGQAKQVIQAGEVLVNGTVETRRRRQLRDGDSVVFAGEEYIVEWTPDDGE